MNPRVSSAIPFQQGHSFADLPKHGKRHFKCLALARSQKLGHHNIGPSVPFDSDINPRPHDASEQKDKKSARRGEKLHAHCSYQLPEPARCLNQWLRDFHDLHESLSGMSTRTRQLALGLGTHEGDRKGLVLYSLYYVVPAL